MVVLANSHMFILLRQGVYVVLLGVKVGLYRHPIRKSLVFLEKLTCLSICQSLPRILFYSLGASLFRDVSLISTRTILGSMSSKVISLG